MADKGIIHHRPACTVAAFGMQGKLGGERPVEATSRPVGVCKQGTQHAEQNPNTHARSLAPFTLAFPSAIRTRTMNILKYDGNWRVNTGGSKPRPVYPFQTVPTHSGTHYLELVWDHFGSGKRVTVMPDFATPTNSVQQ